MVQRLTYRRRHCYATKSNKVKKVKTPGAQLPQASWAVRVLWERRKHLAASRVCARTACLAVTDIPLTCLLVPDRLVGA